jgi:NTE family protein
MTSKTRPRPPFECIALILQGGRAFGAYQAGVYEALTEADRHPDWIAGISIGAINGPLIACNAPETRVDKLRAFWERVTAKPCTDWSERLFPAKGDAVRQWRNQTSANLALASGASGFFTSRFPAPWLHLPGPLEGTSAYALRGRCLSLNSFQQRMQQKYGFHLSPPRWQRNSARQYY